MYAIYYANHYGDGSARVGGARVGGARLSGAQDAPPQLLYSPRMQYQNRVLSKGILTTEVNKSGKLEMTIPAQNPARLPKLTTEVWVERNGAELWRGRVLYDEGTLAKPRDVICEGLLGYLRDGVVPPYSFEGKASVLLANLLETYNAGQTDEWKKFDVGNAADFADVDYSVKNSDYRKISEELKALINKCGGYMKATRSPVTGRNVLDWTARSGPHSAQRIRFGENLLKIKDKISAEDVFTVLIPLGKRQTTDRETTYGGDGKTVQETTNADTIFNYLKTALGLTTAAACGVLANIAAESNYSPTYESGTAYGLCAWRGGRREQLLSRAGSSYNTLGEQLRFMRWELENLYPDVLRYLRGVSNSGRGAYDAAYYWCYDYQVPDTDRASKSNARGNTAANDLWPVYSLAASSGQSIEAPEEGEQLTIANVNDGKDYLENTAAIEVFGKIWRTQLFNDIEDAAELMAEGRKFLKKGLLTRKIELSAVDLSQLGVDVDEIDTGDACDLLVEPLGIVLTDDDAPSCTKIKRNLLKMNGDEYTFGTSFQTLSQQQATEKSGLLDLQDPARGVVAMAAAARSYAAAANAAADNSAGNAADAISAAAGAQVILDSIPDTISAATAAFSVRFSLDGSLQMTCDRTVQEVVNAIRAGRTVIGTNDATEDSYSFAARYSLTGGGFQVTLISELLGGTWSAAGMLLNDVLVLQKN